jgi:hypothetical protein
MQQDRLRLVFPVMPRGHCCRTMVDRSLKQDPITLLPRCLFYPDAGMSDSRRRSNRDSSEIHL